MKNIPRIVILLLLVSSTFIPTFASQGGVPVILMGCNVKNNRAVNGTMAITFLLHSDLDIQHVIFRYENEEGLLTNVTMSLIEGNRKHGWWEASPIRPKILEKKLDSEVIYDINASTMLIYVFLHNSTYEVMVPQHILPSWSASTKSIKTYPEFHHIPLIALCVGIVLMGVVTVRRGRKH